MSWSLTDARGPNVPHDTQRVQHCSTAQAPSAPDFWDVTYVFRGEQHHVQMTYAPGSTVTVNQYGEPRVS